MPVGSLLAVLCLLARRAGAVGTGDVGLLLRLGFHLVVSSSFPSAATTEGDAILEYALKVVFHKNLVELLNARSAFEQRRRRIERCKAAN